VLLRADCPVAERRPERVERRVVDRCVVERAARRAGVEWQPPVAFEGRVEFVEVQVPVWGSIP